MSTNQSAGYVIPLISASGIEQYARQCRLIESKGLRHINDLNEVCDDLAPYGIKRCMKML